MRISTAIVRTPCRNMVNGLTTSNLGIPNFELALKQHHEYVKALKSCNVNVYCMDADENYPDSCFIEDTAIVNEKITVICNMIEPSRSGEEVSIRLKLMEYYTQDKLFNIVPPGTLDGGDIMRVEDTYYIGLSKRTNIEGATQLKTTLSKFGFSTEFVKFDHCLHLKSEVNYLGDGVLLLSKEFQKNPVFQKYKQISVEKEEIYAANSLRVNDSIIVPKGFPHTKKRLLDNGFDVIEIEMSEYQKLDGGLSCLSLRF